MGRPKSSDLSCTICNAKFKKKSLLDKHMEKHLCSTQSRKHAKNYCYTCRKSFKDPDKYKVHMQIEHPFDSFKLNNNNADDLFSYENGYVLLTSKKKIKRGIVMPKQHLSLFEKFPVVSLTDIKIEPADKGNEEFDQTEHQNTEDEASIQQNSVTVEIPKLECSVCGMQCKGEKGLKIHMSAHKKSGHTSNADVSSDENENNGTVNDTQNAQSNNILDVSQFQNNEAVNNDTHNAQSNNILNVSQFQNQTRNFVNVGNHPNIFNASQFQNQPNNIINVANHPINVLSFGNPISSLMNSTNQINAQFLQSFPYQNVLQSDNIPKFDCNSETYMKWLKNFVAKCKEHDYPLNADLCRKVSLVTEELTKALSDPKCALKQKANHFYFMNMYNNLSEIMLNHMQHTLRTVSK